MQRKNQRERSDSRKRDSSNESQQWREQRRAGEFGPYGNPYRDEDIFESQGLQHHDRGGSDEWTSGGSDWGPSGGYGGSRGYGRNDYYQRGAYGSGEGRHGRPKNRSGARSSGSEDLAESVSGVRDVWSELRVRREEQRHSTSSHANEHKRPGHRTNSGNSNEGSRTTAR